MTRRDARFSGVGDGTFEPKVDYPAGDSPRSLAVGDFDHDRSRDLAVATGYNIAILINDD